MKTNLMEFAKLTHDLAKQKGWWDSDKPRTFPEIAALIHCEISEAVESWRKGEDILFYHTENNQPPKPEGLGIELADAIIRIADYCVKVGIDIDEMLAIKHEYNKTRPYRHGGKRA